MMADPTSLELLHDIVLPPPTPWWPPAPGWLWLLAVVSLVALVAVVRGISRWQKNRYRREALAELAKLESAAAVESASDDALFGMSELLKRTALTAFPRPDVAALTGPDWFAFLDRTGSTRFSVGLGATLEQATYEGRSTPDPATTRALAGEIRNWVRRHQAC